MFSSIRSVSTLSQDFRLTITTAQPILQRLDAWRASLPSRLEIRSKDNDENSTGLPNGSASLHIAYHAVKILVIRALLRPFNQPTESGSSSSMQDGQHSDEWLAARARIRNGALNEVTSVLSLIASFRQEHYQAFWAPCTSSLEVFSMSFVFSAYIMNLGSKTSFALVTNLLFLLSVTSHRDSRAVLAISSPSNLGNSQQPQESLPEEHIRDEYLECRRALERARTIFRLHGKTLDMMRFALLRIDAIFWIGWEKVVGFK